MKKFFLKLILLSGLAAVGIMGIILLPYPENSYNLAIVDKHRWLAMAESPKMVLAGGSNIAFGIDSAAIQDSLKLPVTNMGTHASVGLGRMLDDVSPFLNPGDMILIIPEYQHFFNLWNGEAAAYDLIFDARQYRLLYSSRYELPKNFPAYLSTHLLAQISRFRPPNPDAYTRDGFNEYGDYVKHLVMENRPFLSSQGLDGLNISYLNHFFQIVDGFAQRGITVLLSYPGYEEQSWHNSAAFIRELDTILRAPENLTVISNPESYCFPKSLFFDTYYHLNAKGRALRTGQLIADLRAAGLPGTGF